MEKWYEIIGLANRLLIEDICKSKKNLIENENPYDDECLLSEYRRLSNERDLVMALIKKMQSMDEKLDEILKKLG